jgi:hypothetical protein
MKSSEPPGGAVTTMRTVFAGYGCAAIASGMHMSAAMIRLFNFASPMNRVTRTLGAALQPISVPPPRYAGRMLLAPDVGFANDALELHGGILRLREHLIGRHDARLGARLDHPLLEVRSR